METFTEIKFISGKLSTALSMTRPRSLTILGATGSIGTSTLDIVRHHHQRYRVYALSAHTQIKKLLALCLEFKPSIVVVSHEQDAIWLKQQLKDQQLKTLVTYGPENLTHISRAPETDIVIAAIVGAAGLPATLAAAQAGKRILLANKEALVMSGELFMQTVSNAGAELLPIDSEHNAIFQCLPTNAPYYTRSIEQITLTASGGPFRTYSNDRLTNVTPEQACAHPNWSMGKKISVDSATMMNKGLEVIEAHWLFSAPVERIKVVIHPQSIVHSMVTYTDGSVLAQLSYPDMRTPIAHALAYPERIQTSVKPLDLTQYGKLEFEPPCLKRFPCLQLAFDALKQNNGSAVLLNAANEVAVAAFLNRKIRFTMIPDILLHVLNFPPSCTPDSLENILELDKKARADSQQILKRYLN